MSVMSRAADILDPPAWYPDRPPLLPHQKPPEGEWDLWLLIAGRGSGKTEACARYFAKWMRTHPKARARIIAPTFGDAVESCIDGDSGLKAVDPDVAWHPSAPGGAKVSWPNGAEALVLGTSTQKDADRLRAAGNRHLDWWEELAANPQLDYAWDQADLGLRLGTNPHSIGSTTPRNRKKLRELIAADTTVVTRASSYDNPHLSAKWVGKLEDQYAGTRLARQEIHGEVLEDVEGALWTPDLIDLGRRDGHPDLSHVVVAVDPAVTATAESDETGIVVAALGVDHHAYILDDRSCRLSPSGWANRVLAAYDDWEADEVVAEVNNGGDLVEENLAAACTRQGRSMVPYDTVRAKRGKQLRAQPVANLYGDPDDLAASQPRVHHVGVHAELEDQQTTWTPESGASPDRLDALVYAVAHVMLHWSDAPDEVRDVGQRVSISPI